MNCTLSGALEDSRVKNGRASYRVLPLIFAIPEGTLATPFQLLGSKGASALPARTPPPLKGSVVSKMVFGTKDSGKGEMVIWPLTYMCLERMKERLSREETLLILPQHKKK